MLSVFAIVGTVVCYGVFGALVVFLFTHVPTEIVASPEPTPTRLPQPLTHDEAQLMRAFDLV